MGGTSTGADEMVNVGKQKGKIIFLDKSEIPKIEKNKLAPTLKITPENLIKKFPVNS